MSIEDSFQAYLAAQASVTATISTTPVTAIAPVTGSEGLAFPRIIFEKTSDVPVYYAGGKSGLGRARFHIECQARGATALAQAETTRTAVKTLISGIGNNATVGSSKVQRLFIEDDFDVFYPAIHGEEIGVRAKGLEIEMDYV